MILRSWKKLVALLLLSLSPYLATFADEPKIGRFENEIAAYEAKERPQGGTVFLGSSTFTLWGREPEEKFKRFKVVNRGFGGATIPEIIHYLPRILFPLHPRQIVFYAGTNDIADGHSARQVADDFDRFVELARAGLPDVKIAYVSMSMPPSRVRFKTQYEQANQLIRNSLEKRSGLYFVDVSRLLLDAQGKPRPEFFREDALHMRPSGYAIWVPYLEAALEKMAGKSQL